MRLSLIILLISLVAMTIVFVTTGAGHGTYDFARVIYPYTMYQGQKSELIPEFLFWLAFFQYPMYGVIYAISKKYNIVKSSSLILIIIHIGFIILAFKNATSNY